MHTFNTSTQRQRQADLCEFKASLVYVVSSKTAKATQGDPVSEKKKTKKQITSKNHTHLYIWLVIDSRLPGLTPKQDSGPRPFLTGGENCDRTSWP